MTVEPEVVDEVGLFDRFRDATVALVRRLAIAIYRRDEDLRAETLDALERLYTQQATVADLIGAERVILDAESAIERRFGVRPELTPTVDAAAPAPPPWESERRLYAALPSVLPVSFEEALDDLLARRPMMAQTAVELQDYYRDYHAFGAIRATEQAVLDTVQGIIGDALAGGESALNVTELVAEVDNWSRAYADTVVRTNMTGAYAAGRLRQASDPVMSDIIVGLRFAAVGDTDTRPNHHAADGLVAAADDPIWYDLAPPLGYNCRCSIELVDRFTAEAEGLLVDGKLPPAQRPSGAHRDDRFRGQPKIPPEVRRRGQFLGGRPDTVRTRRPNPEALPRGEPKPVRGTPRERRGIRRENETAIALAQAGYDVTQLPESRDETGRSDVSPDLLLGMHIYDVYAPEGSVKSAVRELRRKGDEGRSPRVAINLDGLTGDRAQWLLELRRELDALRVSRPRRTLQILTVSTVGGRRAVQEFWP